MFDVKMSVALLQRFSSREELQAHGFDPRMAKEIFEVDAGHPKFHDLIKWKPGTIKKIAKFSEERFGHGALYFRLWHQMGGLDIHQDDMQKYTGQYHVIRYIPPTDSLEQTSLSIKAEGNTFSFIHDADMEFSGPALLLENRINLLAVGHSSFRLLVFHPGRLREPGRGIMVGLARRLDKMMGTRVLLYHETHEWFGRLKEDAFAKHVIKEIENDHDNLGIIYAI